MCSGHTLNMFFLAPSQEILSRFHSPSRSQPFCCLQDCLLTTRQLFLIYRVVVTVEASRLCFFICFGVVSYAMKTTRKS